MVSCYGPMLSEQNVSLNCGDAWGGGGLPYETDGDAHCLAKGCKFWILVSLRVFRAKRQYVMPPGSHLGFLEETQNYAGLVFFSMIMSLYH